MLNIVRYELFQIFSYVGYALIQTRQPGAVKMELIEQLEYLVWRLINITFLSGVLCYYNIKAELVLTYIMKILRLKTMCMVSRLKKYIFSFKINFFLQTFVIVVRYQS